MSSNSFIWVTEGGDLSTADWGCLAAALACVCRLHAVAVRPAALVSDEKRIRGVYARCAIQINTFAFTFVPFRISHKGVWPQKEGELEKEKWRIPVLCAHFPKGRRERKEDEKMGNIVERKEIK